MNLSNIKYKQKFILKSNGMKYIRLNELSGRVIVKPVNHNVSPLIGSPLTMTFSNNCKVSEVKQ